MVKENEIVIFETKDINTQKMRVNGVKRSVPFYPIVKSRVSSAPL